MLTRTLRKFLLILVVFIAYSAWGQVVVATKLDTANIRIGEQVQLQVKATVGRSQRVIFPSYTGEKEMVPGVEVVRTSSIDTTLLNVGKSMILQCRYTVTSFDSSLYNIVPYVLVGQDTIRSRNSVGLKVATVPVDTVHYNHFNGPHGPVEMPFNQTWRLLLLSFLLLFILAAVVVLAVRLSNKKPLTKQVIVYHLEAPHKVAMAEMEKIKKRAVAETLSSKEYYGLLIDVLRNYIMQRFGINARELTSQEIIEKLTNSHNLTALNELRGLLQIADFVKYAKYESSVNEAEHGLLVAMNYVKETKIPSDDKPLSQKEVVISSNASQRRLHRCMIAVLVFLLLSALLLVAYLVEEIINMFF